MGIIRDRLQRARYQIHITIHKAYRIGPVWNSPTMASTYCFRLQDKRTTYLMHSVGILSRGSVGSRDWVLKLVARKRGFHRMEDSYFQVGYEINLVQGQWTQTRARFIGGRDGKLYIWDIENPASTAGVIQDNTPMTALDTPHTDNLRVFGFNPYYMMFVTGSDELVSIGSLSLSLPFPILKATTAVPRYSQGKWRCWFMSVEDSIPFYISLIMSNGVSHNMIYIGILAIQATSTIAIIHVPFIQPHLFTPFVHISLCNNDNTFASSDNILFILSLHPSEIKYVYGVLLYKAY